MNQQPTMLELCNTLASWLTAPPTQLPTWSVESWESVQKICRVHGIASFLHEILSLSIQAPIRAWLVEQANFNAQRIARMHSELAEILQRFAAEAVPVLPLKGAVLANYYTNPACRPMADLDLLVQPADAAKASRLLIQLGYQPGTVHWKHTEFSKPDNHTVVSPRVEHPDNPRNVELHLHCRETFGGPTIELTSLMWQNARPENLLGQQVMLPTADALWLHLLVHSTYHLWQGRGRLIYLVDLVQVRPHLTQIDDLLMAIDARYTYPTLALLDRYFPNTLDCDLTAQQRQRVSASFGHWVDGLNLVNSSYLNPQPSGLYITKALKFSGGRPKEIVQALRFALLPGIDELALDHPYLAQSAVPWLAYFLLPLDWVKRIFTARNS